MSVLNLSHRSYTSFSRLFNGVLLIVVEDKVNCSYCEGNNTVQHSTALASSPRTLCNNSSALTARLGSDSQSLGFGVVVKAIFAQAA
eukprot:scaffold3586_cov276-Ochromonas_danica.AAC.2